LEVIRWQPPWPLIRTSDREWIVLRDDPSKPVAVVRYLDNAPSGGQYRVVRWAPRSEDRRLFEYFPSLEKADMAVTFIDRDPVTGSTALTSERSPEWGRFERWFWSQASERLIHEAAPAWLFRERLVRRTA
jgi:hypothetical protein